MFSIQTLIAAVALSLTIGFASGYYTKGKFVEAAEVSQIRKDQKQTASNVVAAVAKSTEIDAKVTTDDKSVDAMQIAINARTNKFLTVPENINVARSNNTSGRIRTQFDQPSAAQQPANQVDCPAVRNVLDVGTVRLLNAADTGAALDTTAVIDGKESAASTTTK